MNTKQDWVRIGTEATYDPDDIDRVFVQTPVRA